MEFYEEKIDRRVFRTKRAIRNAFVNLLAEKDFGAITIKEIADLADVNRKTIYNYYKGVYDILEEVENDLLETLSRVFKDVNYEQVLANPLIIFEKLTEALSSDLDFFGHLMRIQSPSHATEKIGKMLQRKMYDTVMQASLNKDPVYVGTIVEFISSGMVAAYRVWFNSGRTQPIEDVSRQIGNMVLYGVAGLKNDSLTGEGEKAE